MDQTKKVSLGEPIFLQETLQEDVVPTPAKNLAFSQDIVDYICEEVAAGKTLTSILGRNGLPDYKTFCRWRRLHPEIVQQLDQAKEDRTEFLRDEMYGLVDEVDEDNSAAIRVKMDVLKTLLGAENKRVFGKTSADVNINMPTQILVATGIDRGENNVVEKQVPAPATPFLPEGNEF